MASLALWLVWGCASAPAVESASGPLEDGHSVVVDWVPSDEPLSPVPEAWADELSPESGGPLTSSELDFAADPWSADLLAVGSPLAGGGVVLRPGEPLLPFAPAASGAEPITATIGGSAVLLLGVCVISAAIVHVWIREDTRRNPDRYAAMQAALTEGFRNGTTQMGELAGQLAGLFGGGVTVAEMSELRDTTRALLRDVAATVEAAKLEIYRRVFCRASGAAIAAQQLAFLGVAVLVACEPDAGSAPTVLPMGILPPPGLGAGWIKNVLLLNFATRDQPMLFVNGRGPVYAGPILQIAPNRLPALRVAVQWVVSGRIMVIPVYDAPLPDV